MKAKTRLTESKTALLLSQPFFAALMLDMMTVKIGKFPQVFGGNAPTLATNGKTIWVDEDFIESLTVSEACFVLCHEIGHAMWQHMSRGKLYADMGFDDKPFDHKLWNVAGDFVINDMLVKSKIGKMPKLGLLDRKYSYEMLVDDVYRDLLQEAESQTCPECGGSGEAEDGGSCPMCSGSGTSIDYGPTLDTHVLEIPEDKPSDAQWRCAVQSAKDTAKAMGQMPSHLERFVDSLLESKVPWEDKLRKAMTGRIGRNTANWSRLHRRRYITQGLIIPTYSGFGAGTIVFAVDTSGSMSEDELKQALGECDKILTDCNPERVILIGCDVCVETVIELHGGDTLQGSVPPIGGGGGTSFTPPFEYVADEKLKPDTLIYFTDTAGTFPSESPPYPVIWCCSEDWKKPPFGEVIPAEVFNG